MRAISLWQPWATAVAVGVKRIETRHWYTDYRGPLAIHAAKRWTREEREFAEEAFRSGMIPLVAAPLGAIVATCVLRDCVPTEGIVLALKVQEHFWGNYERGRFAWLLDDVKALPEPLPFKGMQGFFNVPDSILNSL